MMSTVSWLELSHSFHEKVCRCLFIKNFEFQDKELDIANVGCVESLKTFKKENSAKRVVYVRSGLVGGW